MNNYGFFPLAEAAVIQGKMHRLYIHKNHYPGAESESVLLCFENLSWFTVSSRHIDYGSILLLKLLYSGR